MIGIDWGTSTFRAFRIGPDGEITARRAAPRGILAVEGGRFEEELRRQVGDWLEAGEHRALMSGMIGSRQGWQEVPYVPCPAGLPEIAAGVATLAIAGLDLRLVPGLTSSDSSATPEVMRGEETQILGALSETTAPALACLPGSHSKWARLERDGTAHAHPSRSRSLSGRVIQTSGSPASGHHAPAAGRIVAFETYFTGEAFSALRAHTILGRLMREAPTDLAAFDRGLARAAEPGHLLHHLFGVRTLGLTGRLTEEAAPSYLSGLLIGHEVRAALRECGAPENGTAVHLIGAHALAQLYERAILAAGARVIMHDGEAAAERGLVQLGRVFGWR